MMHGNGMSGYDGCDFGFASGYFSIWHYLIMIGVVLIIIAIGVVAFRRAKSSNGSDVVEKLKMLYVCGEITEEEYLKRKNVIERK